MTTADLEAVLAQMWAGFAPLARSRVEALELWLRAYDEGHDDAELRAAAASAAHKLAGALGSYGRPGSDEASALEVLLRGAVTSEQVRPHVLALRCAVAP
ncbi:MAG: Hpt domain-containing protein [Actinomycetota bacterium]|nr:Hpt domain-containing protein [Actinomycetota bacterium]